MSNYKIKVELKITSDKLQEMSKLLDKADFNIQNINTTHEMNLQVETSKSIDETYSHLEESLNNMIKDKFIIKTGIVEYANKIESEHDFYPTKILSINISK